HDNAAAFACETGDAVDGVGIRQLEVQQHDVGMDLGRQSKATRDCLGRTHDLDIALALEHGRDAFADDWMILDYEHTDHLDTARKGTVTITVVPRPGVLRIIARPPTSRARS